MLGVGYWVSQTTKTNITVSGIQLLVGSKVVDASLTTQSTGHADTHEPIAALFVRIVHIWEGTVAVRRTAVFLEGLKDFPAPVLVPA